MPKCCLFQWFFSLTSRLCSGEKRFENVFEFDFCGLLQTERSWHAYWFCAVIVSGRLDLPSDAKAFSLTSSEMLSSSLRLNKGFGCLISPECLLDRNNYKRFSFCSWMWSSSLQRKVNVVQMWHLPSLPRIANLVQYQSLLLGKLEQNGANVVFATNLL